MKYGAIVFDCDGVILDSNRVKTEAFRQAALPYGETAAEALVIYHTANGGVSRYRKFAHFMDEIVPARTSGPTIGELLERYADAVREGLAMCAIAPGLESMRAATGNTPWFVVSGGDQAELRHVFAQRGIACHFEAIFGSPDTKDEILAREIAAGRIAPSAIFIGDSRYDHQAATAAGLDFAFVSGWSEFAGWQDYAARHGFPVATDLAELASRWSA